MSKEVGSFFFNYGQSGELFSLSSLSFHRGQNECAFFLTRAVWGVCRRGGFVCDFLLSFSPELLDSPLLSLILLARFLHSYLFWLLAARALPAPLPFLTPPVLERALLARLPRSNVILVPLELTPLVGHPLPCLTPSFLPRFYSGLLKIPC